MKKVMLVTGASGSLGMSICSKFSEDYYLLMLDKKKRNFISDLENSGKGTFYKVDLENTDEIFMFLKKVKNYKIAKIILAAGRLTTSPFLTSKLDDWDKTMNVNVKANYIICKELLKVNLEEIHIIVISSIFSSVVGYDLLAYNVSKAAVNHLSKNIALEGINRKVYINSIDLGFMKSEMYHSVKKDENLNINWMYTIGGIETLYINIPDILDLIEYLAKQTSITGETIKMDKGYTLR